MKPIIEVKNLSKEYTLFHKLPYYTLRDTLMGAVKKPLNAVRGKKTSHREKFLALKDVNFSVQRGERVGIIGRNGAGKSTLLKILSQITPPTTGEIHLRGRVASLLEVGTGFHPELTGRENIYLNGAILGMKQKEITKKFDEIVAFAEIEKFLDTPVKRYSSGMYVRLAFAVAAHLEPEILIVDEVLAVGDAQFQKKCLGKMEDVARGGRTILFVSHNMSAVSQLCSRAILLDGGGIQKDGTPQNVIAHYISKGIDQTNGSVDITDQKLRRNSLPESPFKLTYLTLLNSQKKPSVALHFQEPFELALRGKADSDLQNIRVGISIHSALGFPIFHSFQIDSGAPTVIKKGITEFRILLDPNILVPGSYEINVEAHGTGVVDMVPSAMTFNISSANINETVIWENFRAGFVKYPCRWTARTISSS